MLIFSSSELASLAGQPLHKEEGSGLYSTSSSGDYVRCCAIHREHPLHLSRLWLRARGTYARADLAYLCCDYHCYVQDGMLIELCYYV